MGREKQGNRKVETTTRLACNATVKMDLRWEFHGGRLHVDHSNRYLDGSMATLRLPCREKRERRRPCRAHGITARVGPEQATKNPEIAEIFDLPAARIGATAAGFCAVLGSST
jgi:hypothetical protein